jgi:hypothetical protein
VSAIVVFPKPMLLSWNISMEIPETDMIDFQKARVKLPAKVPNGNLIGVFLLNVKIEFCRLSLNYTGTGVIYLVSLDKLSLREIVGFDDGIILGFQADTSG